MSRYEALAGGYDELTGDVPYEAFADYYEKLFAERGVTPLLLLDLACGTGTLACILAGRGYELIAVDASEPMLMRAYEKARALSGAVAPLLLCQELARLDLYGTADAAYCSLDGLNYVPPEDLAQVFRRLHLFIAPAGLLIFDINSPERLRSLDGQMFVDETDDMLCLWRAQFNEDEKLLCYGMDIFARQRKLWRRDFEEHIEYAHEPERLGRLLEEAGFGRIEIRDDGPQSIDGRIFFVAERS